MAYQVADLQPGMVILCRAQPHEPIWDRLLDDAIALSTAGPYVHAAMVGNGQLLEQIDPVITSPLTKYVENGDAFRVAGLTSEKAQAAIRWALQRLGQPYSIPALLEDGAWYDLHLPAMLQEHPRFYTCSGFVNAAFRLGASVTLTAQPLPSPLSLAFSPVLLGPRPWDHA